MERAVYKPLPFRRLKTGAGYQRPIAYKAVQVDSPAIEVMTDLRNVSAVTISPDVLLSQATQAMVSRGWAEGKTFRIEYRGGEGRQERHAT